LAHEEVDTVPLRKTFSKTSTLFRRRSSRTDSTPASTTPRLRDTQFSATFKGETELIQVLRALKIAMSRLLSLIIKATQMKI
jgi:hypothetical protein